MTIVIVIYKPSHVQVKVALSLWAFPIPTQVM